MSELFTLEIDGSKLMGRVQELHDALIGQGQAGDAATIFEDEARRFVQGVIRLTPPRNQKQGEAAISRDLMKVFTPVTEDLLNTIGSEHGLSAIDVWMTTAGGEKKELDWRKIDPTGAGMADFHRRNRNSRGKTYNLKKQRGDKWYAPYVVTFEDYAAYRDKMFARVGRRKAAWAKSFAGLGGKVAGWISRHLSGAKGEFVWRNDPNKPSITMINRSPGIQGDEHIIRSALRVRTEAIQRRIKLVLSGYSKDVSQGMKISRKAYKTSESLQEAA